MTKVYRPIKNEAYPWITLQLIVLSIGVILLTQSAVSFVYMIMGILFIAGDVVILANTYGIIFAYISINSERIEYLYRKTHTKIKWNEILNVRNAYPNKKVFARRKELYQIQVIAITSESSKDIYFHYVVGNKIESVERIQTPYTTDPSLSKGIWLSSKDALALLNYIRNKIPKHKVKLAYR